MDPKKTARAFDLMVLGLADAGYDATTIGKFVQNARRQLGIPADEDRALKAKSEFAVLAAEVKDDSTVDRGGEANLSGKTGRARSGALPG